MWLFFAAISGLLFTFEELFSRFILKAQKDAWAYSFYFSLIGTIVSLPFFLASPKIPSDLQAWVLILLLGALIVFHNLLYFKAFHYIEASIAGSILRLSLVWTLIFGVIVFNESVTWEKVLGIIFTLIAGVLIVHKFNKPASLKGIMFVLAAGVLNAVIIILLKYMYVSFNTGSLTLFAYLVPTVLNFLLMPRARSRVKNIIKLDGGIIFLACGLGALANLAQNHALSLGDASRVVVIIQASLILRLVGEHIWFNEREQPWVKAVAVIFATVGAVLMCI